MRLVGRARGSFGLLAAVCIGAAVAGSASAAPVGLVTVQSDSTVTARANDLQSTPKVTTDNVTSFPFVKTTSATSGQSTSSVDSNLSNAGFGFTFTQAIGNFGDTDGQATINFTATQNLTYSLSGQMGFNGLGTFGEFLVSLQDHTAGNSFLYNYDKFTTTNAPIGTAPQDGVQGLLPPPSASLSLDTSGGSLTGSLIAGHSYTFSVEQLMTNVADPSLNGNVNLVLNGPAIPPGGGGSAVPLPAGVWGGVIGLGVMMAYAGARRRVVG